MARLVSVCFSQVSFEIFYKLEIKDKNGELSLMNWENRNRVAPLLALSGELGKQNSNPVRELVSIQGNLESFLFR